jgi:hypothetical protein
LPDLPTPKAADKSGHAQASADEYAQNGHVRGKNLRGHEEDDQSRGHQDSPAKNDPLIKAIGASEQAAVLDAFGRFQIFPAPRAKIIVHSSPFPCLRRPPFPAKLVRRAAGPPSLPKDKRTEGYWNFSRQPSTNQPGNGGVQV